MAKYSIYSVRDVHNGFGLPICDYNDRTAKRSFLAAVSQDGVMSPGDYDLFCIGTFDTESGTIEPLAYPSIVSRGTEVFAVRAAEKQPPMEGSNDP